MVSDLRTTPKEVVTCEEAPRGASELTQEDWQNFLGGMNFWENEQRQEMNRYKMVRVHVPSFFKTATAKNNKSDDAQPEKPSAKKRKSKPKPETNKAG